MAVRGFVEYVSVQQIRGWTHDTQTPDSHLDIAINVRGVKIASGTADLYRTDLFEAGVGKGDHGFVINLDPMLSEGDLPTITVSAATPAGEIALLKQLQNDPATGVWAPARKEPPVSPGEAIRDSTQYPVFILGAARSGTSAIAQALLKTGYYAGHQEGHVLALMALQMKTIQDYYANNGDETLASRDTTLARIPKEYFMNAVAKSFKDLIPLLWRNKYWIDKTPNSDMIIAAPLFLHLWPNARFVFMKRRPLENLVSRLQKFPQRSFEDHCLDWASVMKAWRATRSALGAQAIEIEQFELATHPEETAARLADLLRLPPSVARLLRQTLLVERPERTSQRFADPLTLDDLDWTGDQRADFQRICGPLMLENGYTTDKQYYRTGSP
jgi:hypothetical protein